MKKRLTAIITVAIILANLTACSNSSGDISQSDQSYSSNENSQNGENSENSDGGSDSRSNSETPESSESGDDPANPDSGQSNEIKTRYVYGDVEIPDLPDLSEGEEGRANTLEGYLDKDRYIEKSKEFERCLDSMVFETHTLGEYTVRLVADKVRTDSVNFPGYIFVQHPTAEIEKNGERIGEITHDGWINYTAQFGTEYRFHANKIGDYVDIYDLEVPVVALRYWFDDDPRRLVTKCVRFATVTEPYNGHIGSVEDGIGVMINTNINKAFPFDYLAPSDGTAQTGYWSIFGSDEFKVVDKNTILDEKAGIEFTFDFREDTDIFNPKKYSFYAKWVN